MSCNEDLDLQLQRASASLQNELEILLPRLLRKRRHDLVSSQLVHTACNLIEPFQEDPQLLDTHLKTLVPPLVAAYLRTLQEPLSKEPKKGHVLLTYAISYILNLLCKVRGEKVIKGFFNNEPRYLESILDQVETRHDLNSLDNQSEVVVPWMEQHVLLLWLSHLLLAPFPLDTISALQPSAEISEQFGIELPSQAPEVTLRVLTICLERLKSASKERGAAADLLVKICIRPDMQQIGLLRSLVQWATKFLAKASDTQVEIHHALGIISFLSGLVSSADIEDIGPFLPVIYQSCRNILDQEHLTLVKSSAVARKLVIKTMRNIVVHVLRSGTTSVGLDPDALLEEVIEFLLESMADSDSPVRYGTSKALSVITLKLENEMAGDVIDAILGSLSENVYWQGSKRNISGVNPLRWHGLTLTLSHLLYRKAIPIEKLPDVLNALLLSLSFEQRSPTGGSVGTNVRDAACFGIWALSRRYSTTDLLNIETTEIRACEQHKSLSVPQTLAIELIIAACIDPAGNIRRGSSAALQELIGRHPNTIEEGIPLVQIVDFHAVGLRQRAMCEVVVKTGGLHQVYWCALFENLLGWRGTSSLDADSRLWAATAIGSLSKMQSEDTIRSMSDRICEQLATLKHREVEERQGLVSALAALVNTTQVLASTVDLGDKGLSTRHDPILNHLWKLLKAELMLEDKAFTSPALRPQLTASSMLHFLAALAAMTNCLSGQDRSNDIPVAEIARILNLCLARHEDDVLDAIIITVPGILTLFSVSHCKERDALVAAWLSLLENEASYNGVRCSGHTVALGSSYAILATSNDSKNSMDDTLELQKRIVQILTFRCTVAVAIEARIVALRALRALVQTSCKLAPAVEDQICSALHVALNDYTITERGDIGSLVRLEALEVTGLGWSTGILRKENNANDTLLHSDVLRLSLEKLDKTRNRAAKVLEIRSGERDDNTGATTRDVSSVAYFLKALRSLQVKHSSGIQESTCLGFVSSAGMGSESVLQHARIALLHFVNGLPDDDTATSPSFTLLNFATTLLDCFRTHLDDEKITIPLLEVIAFLLDMQVLQRLISSSFKFRSLLSLTQKVHFKSTHMQKLQVALDVYRGLGQIPATRNDTITKLTGMLLHPFPKIRMASAEILWLLTHEAALKVQDWSLSTKALKTAVDGIRVRLGVAV